MRNDPYEHLRKQYPSHVNKEQLYKICQISKKSAKYLLDNGVIPCTDNGKKTRKYDIALNDIITYLKKRDSTGKSMIPKGVATSRKKGPRSSYSEILLHEPKTEVRRYFEFLYGDFPDVIYPHDLIVMTGLSGKTIFSLLRNGNIKSLTSGNQYLIPKTYLFDFVTSPRFIAIKSNSTEFIKILGGFQIWKTVKS